MSSTKPTIHRSNLVTLGSAAVLVVYTIGYVRTKSAADLFASESVDRRPVRPASHQPAAPSAIAPVAESAGARAADGGSVGRKVGGPNAKKAQHNAIAPTHLVDSAVVTTLTQQPVTPTSAPAPAPSAPPTPVVSATPAVDTVAKADTAPSVRYKDGFYRGYGTSRHGDIEVELETRNGKIVYARISQCLTQYSCSWISALPDEVLLRQSADVDYISGATQSTNAFYLAVVQALAKAK